MELAGITFEPDRLVDLRQQLEKNLNKLEKIIYEYAALEFNIASPLQLSQVLYKKLKLPTEGIGKGRQVGHRTGFDQLKKIRQEHPIIDCILGWREFNKLQTTYVDALPKHLDSDGRIRSQFQITGAITGRLSSQKPNLQNIPQTDLGQVIRGAFLAPPGQVFINADYSQFELRLAAVLADEPELLETFLKGGDVHRATAAAIFNQPESAVTAQQRLIAKTVNFGVLYGQGPHKLAEQANLSYQEAREFIDDYFAKRPKLAAYLEEIKKQIQTSGYVETWFGRRRFFPEAKVPTNKSPRRPKDRRSTFRFKELRPI